MRDPRAGAYGVVAVVLLLALKLAALASLPPSAPMRQPAGGAVPGTLGHRAGDQPRSPTPAARGWGGPSRSRFAWTHVVVAGAIAAEVAVLVLGVAAGIVVWFLASIAALSWHTTWRRDWAG